MHRQQSLKFLFYFIPIIHGIYILTLSLLVCDSRMSVLSSPLEKAVLKLTPSLSLSHTHTHTHTHTYTHTHSPFISPSVTLIHTELLYRYVLTIFKQYFITNCYASYRLTVTVNEYSSILFCLLVICYLLIYAGLFKLSLHFLLSNSSMTRTSHKTGLNKSKQ